MDQHTNAIGCDLTTANDFLKEHEILKTFLREAWIAGLVSRTGPFRQENQGVWTARVRNLEPVFEHLHQMLNLRHMCLGAANHQLERAHQQSTDDIMRHCLELYTSLTLNGMTITLQWSKDIYIHSRMEPNLYSMYYRLSRMLTITKHVCAFLRHALETYTGHVDIINAKGVSSTKAVRYFSANSTNSTKAGLQKYIPSLYEVIKHWSIPFSGLQSPDGLKIYFELLADNCNTKTEPMRESLEEACKAYIEARKMAHVENDEKMTNALHMVAPWHLAEIATEDVEHNMSILTHWHPSRAGSDTKGKFLWMQHLTSAAREDFEMKTGLKAWDRAQP